MGVYYLEVKQRITRLAKISGYSFLGVAIVVFTIFLVTIGRGYFFDFKTGQIAGGGLILLDSKPDNASVWLDNKELGKGTPTRVPLRDGNYVVRLTKDGYRPWQKQLKVETSAVTWARYPLLLPNTITTNPVTNLTAPTQVEQSPDHRFLVIGSSVPAPGLQQLELGKTELRNIYTFTPEQLAAGTIVDSIVWSPDNEHVLVGLKAAGQVSYVVINALNPAEVFELTKEFSLPLGNLQFNPRNWREIYWLSPEGLRKLDLANKTVSAVLVPAVTSFLVSEDALFYVQTQNNVAQIFRLERDNQSRLLVDRLAPADYQLDYINFDGAQYIVIFNRTAQRISLYHSSTASGQQLEEFKDMVVRSISTAPDDRYLIMQNGSSFASYDFEFTRIYHFNLAAQNLGRLAWLDRYHLLSNAGGSLVMFEFDGGNLEVITDGLDGFTPAGARGLDFIYSVGRSNGSGAMVLHASQIKK